MKANLRKTANTVISLFCLLISAFHIFVAWDSSISVVQQRVLHVFMMLTLYFALEAYKASGSEKRKPAQRTAGTVAFTVMSVLCLALGVFFMQNTTLSALSRLGVAGASQIQIVMGVALILVVLFVAARSVGFALTILSLVFIAYAMLGKYMPEIIAHKGYTIPFITSYVAWTTESIFGTCIGAAVSFVALYIVFGELLEKFGAGQFFIDMAYALTGRMKGGPAEASVVSSALMGSINGSAVANVVTTGTFTIPLMKKVGYRPEFAGAVEAVASTGGQLLPPVMGAAAFVMADMTGIPYSTIIIAAIIPGLLYYLSLGVAVFLEADKRGLQAEDASRLPQVKKVLREGWYYLIPIVLLVVCLLALNMSANTAAIYAIVCLLLIGSVKALVSEKRLPIRELYDALVSAAKTTIPVSVACACAGIVIGIVSMTGIGVKFTSIVFRVSGGNLFLMLAMIMLACIIMGMGLPSTAAYIIAASIGAPALINAGIPEIAAHLYVFYFAIISFITPPVALSAYAASGIANASASKTGWLAFMLGLPGFIIPYIYAYRPALLIVDTPAPDTLAVLLFTTVAVVITAAAVIGWFKGRMSVLFRLLTAAAAVLLIVPSIPVNMGGLALTAALFGTRLVRGKKAAA